MNAAQILRPVCRHRRRLRRELALRCALLRVDAENIGALRASKADTDGSGRTDAEQPRLEG